jgi:hypothetical protein
MVGSVIMAQSIDRSQYDETALFDVKLWEREGTTMATKKYKATVLFVTQGSSANLYITDLDGESQTSFRVDRRWPTMTRGQRVTIYFTARKSYGSGDTPALDDIQY